MSEQNPSAKQELKRIRHYMSTVLNTAEKFFPCHGGIFRDNVSGVFEDHPDLAVLGNRTDVLELWMKWISEGSANVAYIPPEGIAALPTIAEDLSKVDSWALGCLTIQMINCDEALTLKRQNRFSRAEYLRHDGTIEQLKEFYKDAGQSGLAVGPEMQLLKEVPCACEEFLAHCLEPDPAKRWSLAQLRQLPFLDLNRSLADLFAMDAAHYQQLLPIEGMFTVTNIRPHPFMPSDQALTVQVGDIQWTDGACHQPSHVDIWRFILFGRDANEVEEQRRLKIKAFGKLLDALTMENNKDARADYYAIRALQKGTKNLVHHFGCQFVSNQLNPLEFQVFTEHCPGGNLGDAAVHHLPVEMVVKCILEVLEGLKYLHGHGIVHRNLNSSIVFFSENPFKGAVKIGGFHLMRQLEGVTSVKNEISVRSGSDGRFVAPEMMDTEKDDDLHTGRKCDTWSLGCIALHLVSGHPPLYIGAKDKPVVLEVGVLYHLKTVKTLPEIPAWIPSNIRNFIMKCLVFNPAQRPYAADLDTHALLSTDIDDAAYRTSRGGIPLPEGVAENWRR
ncbi:uncharacterized protein LOC129597467 [Paramacrobiotus metropolitanus]|uniref:uncharacterized protein LOC129597467 n=1 Tax=Paramacrobiotus metropolitanus TaxID=2943436 RepID=UPI002445F333|nr:uncharacterized protein LOC129597467 [Paramacrobiotus metropolitanus]